MAERAFDERFEKAKKCCERLLELVKKGSYCDLTVKMEDGKITIWTILTKEKP